MNVTIYRNNAGMGCGGITDPSHRRFGRFAPPSLPAPPAALAFPCGECPQALGDAVVLASDRSTKIVAGILLGGTLLASIFGVRAIVRDLRRGY